MYTFRAFRAIVSVRTSHGCRNLRTTYTDNNKCPPSRHVPGQNKRFILMQRYAPRRTTALFDPAHMNGGCLCGSNEPRHFGQRFSLERLPIVPLVPGPSPASIPAWRGQSQCTLVEPGYMCDASLRASPPQHSFLPRASRGRTQPWSLVDAAASPAPGLATSWRRRSQCTSMEAE